MPPITNRKVTTDNGAHKLCQVKRDDKDTSANSSIFSWNWNRNMIISTRETPIIKAVSYINIENIGNTFCASIPIAIDQMLENKLIEKGNKVLLLGYGGGLNTGVILLEI